MPLHSFWTTRACIHQKWSEQSWWASHLRRWIASQPRDVGNKSIALPGPCGPRRHGTCGCCKSKRRHHRSGTTRRLLPRKRGLLIKIEKLSQDRLKRSSRSLRLWQKALTSSVLDCVYLGASMMKYAQLLRTSRCSFVMLDGVSVRSFQIVLAWCPGIRWCMLQLSWESLLI